MYWLMAIAGRPSKQASRGGHGARQIDIGAEIAAGIHAGKHPLGVGREMRKRDPRAVDRRAVEHVAVGGQLLQMQWRAGRRLVAATGQMAVGSEYQIVPQRLDRAPQGRQTWRFDTVVVGEQKRHVARPSVACARSVTGAKSLRTNEKTTASCCTPWTRSRQRAIASRVAPARSATRWLA